MDKRPKHYHRNDLLKDKIAKTIEDTGADRDFMNKILFVEVVVSKVHKRSHQIKKLLHRQRNH